MERDTDMDWRTLGASEPFWSVLTEERFRQDRMDENARRAFYATGTSDIRFVLSRIALMIENFRPLRALDFGCGTGRLTLAMARRADAVTGIDISPDMLAEATRAAGEYSIGNARFLESLPEDATYDWINSYIVLQHIPPRRGYALLDELLGRLAPGGVCSIQVCVLREQDNAREFVGYGAFWSFDGEVARLGLDNDSRSQGTVRMYDYDLNRIIAIFLSHNVEPFGIAPTNHGGHRGVWLFGQAIPAPEPPADQ